MLNKFYILIAGAAIFLILLYFLFFHVNSNINIKSNSIIITYNNYCNNCSNNIIKTINDIFKSEKAHLSTINVSFKSKEGISFISNFSVTSLPSIILNQTNTSTNILDSLVYLNIFNVLNGYYVLNTPFVSGITRGVKYFDLIQNRTITSFDIFNQSYVYRNTNTSVINPSEILYLINGTNYTKNKKVEISFVYGNSSFSAIQSLILYKALSGFGNFSNLSIANSPTIRFSNGETLGNTQFYVLNGSKYESKYFFLESSSLNNLSSSIYVKTLEKQLFEFDQNSGYGAFNNIGNFLPFIDIGGRYVEVSSMINPKIFQNKNIKQIKEIIANNKTAGTAFNDSVYFVQTLLCSYVGYNNTICNNKIIKNDLININSLI